MQGLVGAELSTAQRWCRGVANGGCDGSAVPIPGSAVPITGVGLVYTCLTGSLRGGRGTPPPTHGGQDAPTRWARRANTAGKTRQHGGQDEKMRWPKRTHTAGITYSRWARFAHSVGIAYPRWTRSAHSVGTAYPRWAGQEVACALRY